MLNKRRLGCFLIATLLCTAAAGAQQNSPQNQPAGGRIHLDVVVAPKSGPPVGDLQQQDFTIEDNKAPQTITSFAAVSGRQAPLEVVLVVDAVNTGYQRVSIERTEIGKFLRAEGGHLEYPTVIAVFTDKGIHTLGGFSNDGNALGAALDEEDVALRSIVRSTGFYGAAERVQLSLKALSQLVAGEAARPGRKLILWVSPGWPLMSGANTAIDQEQHELIFANIVTLSNQLLRSRVTLYSIDPLGSDESISRVSSYKEFLKGISKPSQVYMGNLALQVLAVQSGGLALSLTNDIAGLLRECLADAAPYYEITFDPQPATQRDEYHHMEIKLAKPDLTARTRQGYYGQPSPHN